MAIIKSKFSGNEYWEELISNPLHSDGLPRLTTDSLSMGGSLDANAGGTILSVGNSALTSYGFVWATHNNPTLDDNVAEVGTSHTGSYSDHLTSLSFGTVYVAAYATNSQGSVYGRTLSGSSFICLAAGTLVKTINGNKKIENVTYNDCLLVWDFDNAKFNFASPIWIVTPFKADSYCLVKFSNGTELKTVADGKGHRIFNFDRGMFTHMVCDKTTPVGTRTFTSDKKLTYVVSKEIIKEETCYYNVITDKHINNFANDILTSTGLNNLYPVANMKFVKEPRQLRTRQEFEVSENLFTGLRLAEQPLNNYPNLKNKLHFMLKRQLPL